MSAIVMDASRPRPIDYTILFVLAGIWGASFLFIKISVATLPPLTLTAGRLIVAALVLLAIVWASGRALPRGRRIWLVIFLVGFTGNAMPFSLISWGEGTVDAGLAAMLMAGMPLFTIVLAHLFTSDERLTVTKLIGVGLGIVGLVVLVGPEKLVNIGDDTVRQLAIVLASLCYAVNAVLTKALVGEDPYAVSAGIMIAAAVPLVPASLFLEAPLTLDPSLAAIASMVALGAFGTALASIQVLALVRRRGASFFSQINFLVPLFGVLWGAVFLAERPPASAWIALALILGGIAISRARRERPIATLEERP